MPVRRRIAHPRRVGCTRRQYRTLSRESWTRHRELARTAPFGVPVDLDWVADMWREVGAEIMAEYVAVNPGTRPRGWWAVVAGSPRRQLNPGYQPVQPRDWRLHHGAIDNSYRGTPTDPYPEPEHEYLTRLDLWESGERTRFDDMAKARLAKNAERSALCGHPPQGGEPCP